MQLVEFNARCPFELGDKIPDGDKMRTITDIVCLHYLKNPRVEFMYELDNSGKLVYITLGTKKEDEPLPHPLPPTENAYVRTELTKLTPVSPDGKIVGFPALPSPPPVGTDQREKDVEWAALMLETLRNYCETMAAVKGDQTVPWTDYADALDVAIAVLRK